MIIAVVISTLPFKFRFGNFLFGFFLLKGKFKLSGKSFKTIWYCFASKLIFEINLSHHPQPQKHVVRSSFIDARLFFRFLGCNFEFNWPKNEFPFKNFFKKINSKPSIRTRIMLSFAPNLFFTLKNAFIGLNMEEDASKFRFLYDPCLKSLKIVQSPKLKTPKWQISAWAMLSKQTQNKFQLKIGFLWKIRL